MECEEFHRLRTDRPLAADEGRFELLGLRDDCETAVFWDHVRRGAVEAGFDAHGVDDLAAAHVEQTDDVGKVEYLESANVERWDLVHPRHQWIR